MFLGRSLGACRIRKFVKFLRECSKQSEGSLALRANAKESQGLRSAGRHAASKYLALIIHCCSTGSLYSNSTAVSLVLC